MRTLTPPTTGALRRPAWLPTLLALLFCTLWATAFVVTKTALAYAPPFIFQSVRYLLAGTIMALAVLWQAQPWPSGWRSYAAIALFGLFNTALYIALNALSLRQLSAGMGAIIASTNPLLLALIAPWLLGERLDRFKLLGMLLGFAGVCFVMAVRLGGTTDTLGGMALSFGSVLSLLAATLLFKRMRLPESLLAFNAIQLFAAGMALLPFALLLEWGQPVHFAWPLLGLFAYSTGGISILATLIWLWLLQRGEASRVSAYFFLTPVLGLAVSALTLGERFGWRELIGLLAVAAGIALVNRSPR